MGSEVEEFATALIGSLAHLHELHVLSVRAIVSVTMPEASVTVKAFVFVFDV